MRPIIFLLLAFCLLLYPLSAQREKEPLFNEIHLSLNWPLIPQGNSHKPLLTMSFALNHTFLKPYRFNYVIGIEYSSLQLSNDLTSLQDGSSFVDYTSTDKAFLIPIVGRFYLDGNKTLLIDIGTYAGYHSVSWKGTCQTANTNGSVRVSTDCTVTPENMLSGFRYGISFGMGYVFHLEKIDLIIRPEYRRDWNYAQIIPEKNNNHYLRLTLGCRIK